MSVEVTIKEGDWFCWRNWSSLSADYRACFEPYSDNGNARDILHLQGDDANQTSKQTRLDLPKK